MIKFNQRYVYTVYINIYTYHRKLSTKDETNQDLLSKRSRPYSIGFVVS